AGHSRGRRRNQETEGGRAGAADGGGAAGRTGAAVRCGHECSMGGVSRGQFDQRDCGGGQGAGHSRGRRRNQETEGGRAGAADGGGAAGQTGAAVRCGDECSVGGVSCGQLDHRDCGGGQGAGDSRGRCRNQETEGGRAGAADGGGAAGRTGAAVRCGDECSVGGVSCGQLDQRDCGGGQAAALPDALPSYQETEGGRAGAADGGGAAGRTGAAVRCGDEQGVGGVSCGQLDQRDCGGGQGAGDSR